MKKNIYRVFLSMILCFILHTIAGADMEVLIFEVENNTENNMHIIPTIVTEADNRCQDVARTIKDELYLPEAYLKEKEECVVKEFATILVESNMAAIENNGSDVIQQCLKEAKDKTKEKPEEKANEFGACMWRLVSKVAVKAATPCRDIKSYIKTGLGGKECEDEVKKAMVDKFMSMISPKKSSTDKLEKGIYNIALKIAPIAPMVALAFFLFYIADIIWNEQGGIFQYVVVGGALMIFLVLYIFKGFIAAPVLMVLVLFFAIGFNQFSRMRKTIQEKPPDTQALVENILKETDSDNDQQPL